MTQKKLLMRADVSSPVMLLGCYCY